LEFDFENMRCSEYRIHNGEENILFNLSPGNLTSTTNRRPIICAALRSGSSTLNFTTTELYLDGNKTQYKLEGTSILYNPLKPLSLGSHTAKLLIKDSNDNNHEFSWSFIVEEGAANLNFYLGSPHSHTSYSDGYGTPTEAYEKARSNGLDFLIVTDHQGKLVRGTTNYDNTIKIFGKESPKWEMLKLEADFINNKYKDFLALYGYELNTWFWGHINIINSINLIKKKPFSIEELYDWLNKERGILISINHPYRSPKTQPFTHNLDNFVNLYEVANGSTTRVYTRAEELYFRALDEGWHIAAVNGQDNHIDDWGVSSNATAVIAKKLSINSIIEAIKLRRVYSTESRTLKLTVKGNNQWMGSIVNLKRGAVLELYIHCEDTINPIEKLQVITNGGKIISEKSFNSPNSCTWEPVIPIKEDYAWYVIKVIHTNGQIAMSSAIFVENIKLTG
jgi:predicted metal-dependent phosphoesterase TrpH